MEAKNITTPTSSFLGWSEFLFPFDVDRMKETINVDLLNVTHTCTIWNILNRFEIHRLSWISLSPALSLSVSVSGSLWSLHFCCNHVKLRNFVANCWETLNYGIFCCKNWIPRCEPKKVACVALRADSAFYPDLLQRKCLVSSSLWAIIFLYLFCLSVYSLASLTSIKSVYGRLRMLFKAVLFDSNPISIKWEGTMKMLFFVLLM